MRWLPCSLDHRLEAATASSAWPVSRHHSNIWMGCKPPAAAACYDTPVRQQSNAYGTHSCTVPPERSAPPTQPRRPAGRHAICCGGRPCHGLVMKAAACSAPGPSAPRACGGGIQQWPASRAAKPALLLSPLVVALPARGHLQPTDSLVWQQCCHACDCRSDALQGSSRGQLFLACHSSLW